MEVFKKKISETKKHALMRRLYDEAQLVLVKMNEVQTLCIRLDEGTGTPADEYDWASLLHDMACDYKLGSWSDRETLAELCCDIDDAVVNGLPVTNK